jgi:hypothetical protein
MLQRGGWLAHNDIISNAVPPALNLSVFLLIGKTSALTMNIAGVVKDWILIGLSVLLFKYDQLQPLPNVKIFHCIMTIASRETENMTLYCSSSL